MRKLGRKNKKETNDIMENRNGYIPFLRAFQMSVFIVSVSAIFSILSWKGWVLSPPTSALDTTYLYKWIFLSIFCVHFVLFFLGYLSSIYILPQSNLRYNLWIFKETAAGSIKYFLVLESLIVILIGIFMNSSPDSTFLRTLDNGYTPMQLWAFNLSVLSMVIPPWLGYASAWKGYRLFGAMTMQDRYNMDAKKLDRKISGQFYERRIDPVIDFLLGRKRMRPKGSILWFLVVAPLTLSISWGVGVYNDSLYLTGFLPISFIPISLLIFISLAKYRDGKFRIDEEPVLEPIRGPDTDDSYNPNITKSFADINQ